VTASVRIAGAGPSGLCAALLLRRAGLTVELRERRAQVGGRFHGAVHGVENWSSSAPFSERLESWGVDLAPTLRPCHELVLCDARTSHVLRSAQPLFYLVRRGPDPDCLEGRLLHLALEAGVELRLGARFERGAADLDATGPSSERRACVEAGFHFHTRSQDLAAALVDRVATPAGYAYLLVRSGHGSLSVVRFDGQGVSQEQLSLAEGLLRRHVDVDVNERRPGAGFGSFSLHALFGQGRCWALGERAGLQDFLWGFGIRRALESAALAARCWLDGSEYPALAARTFGFPDRAALVNRYLWDATAARGLPVYVRALARSGDIRAALARATAERWLHRALYPLLVRHARRRFPQLANAG
jgi:hypothetical protein